MPLPSALRTPIGEQTFQRHAHVQRIVLDCILTMYILIVLAMLFCVWQIIMHLADQSTTLFYDNLAKSLWVTLLIFSYIVTIILLVVQWARREWSWFWMGIFAMLTVLTTLFIFPAYYLRSYRPLLYRSSPSATAAGSIVMPSTNSSHAWQIFSAILGTALLFFVSPINNPLSPLAILALPFGIVIGSIGSALHSLIPENPVAFLLFVLLSNLFGHSLAACIVYWISQKTFPIFARWFLRLSLLEGALLVAILLARFIMH